MYVLLKIELLKCWLCQSILSDAQKERTAPGDDDAGSDDSYSSSSSSSTNKNSQLILLLPHRKVSKVEVEYLLKMLLTYH